MADAWRVARLYLVVLLLFTIGRWVQGLQGVAYDRAHHVFSIVTLTFMAAFFFAAFCRAWRGYGFGQALLMGVLLGLSAQVVIFLSTLASYALGLETFFNNPRALNVEAAIPMAEALGRRVGGLVFGPLFDAIAAGLGWAAGALLPPARGAQAAAAADAAPTT